MELEVRGCLFFEGDIMVCKVGEVDFIWCEVEVMDYVKNNIFILILIVLEVYFDDVLNS